MTSLIPVVLALPWVALPVATIFRARNSRSLADEAHDVQTGAPTVSVVIPARNEEHNIERCVRSVLASSYPTLDVVVVEDHSTDGTAAILARIGAEDARLRVITPDPLPAGWFGKQWACTAGANASTGEIIAFFDADTQQTPDLIVRAVNAMTSRDAELLTVAGDQELGSFWERVIQPQVFAVMLMRYGGTETVNASRRASDKIANGQCIFVRRSAYAETNGHAAVKHKVAEDLAMAQHYFRTGRRSFLVLGLDQLSTRMYTSLGALIGGWGKNLYAGGRDSVPGGAIGRSLAPFLLCSPWIGALAPITVLALSIAGLLGHAALVWSAIATGATLLWWLGIYVLLGLSPLYALLYPVGAAMMLYISLGAIARGSRVRWKDREYVSA